MRKKSKELLDNLNKIVEKPKNKFVRDIFDVITNRYYIPNSLHTLPKSYDKEKRCEDKDWLDGEYVMIDRIYGGLYEQQLRQKDLTIYEGKLYNKKRLVKSEVDGKNFYSKCTVTSDGRWFDNCGFPIEPPKQVDIEPEAKPDEDDIENEKRIAREREQRIIAGLK
jgi:hypothetical protein